MNRSLRWIGIVLCLIVGVSVIDAQERALVWERWDITLDGIDTQNNSFQVTEAYTIAFSGGFRFGTAVIPRAQLENIDSIGVTQNGRPLAASCSGNEGTFCTANSAEGLEITYYFLDPLVNETASFALSYRVLGGLRSYSNGDQLWWIAIPQDKFGFPVRAASITVELPNGFAPREGVDPVVTYGAPADVSVSGSRVTATATRGVRADEALEIRVQYPHDPNGRVVSWQSEFDSRRAFEEGTLPLLNLGAIVLSLLIALGSALGIYALYNARGRDPKIGVVPEYLSEPPSALRPAVVGSLIDERADPRDVIATFVDLAHRGYMVFEEVRSEGMFGIGRSTFTFKRTEKAFDDLQSWEATLMGALFPGGAMERDLSALRETFYRHITAAQARLYSVLVEEGFFTRSPEATRTSYSLVGVVVFALAIVVFTLVLSSTEAIGTAGLLLAGSLLVPSLGLTLIASAMPSKTRKGAEEAAKWKAFYNYMTNLEKFGSVDEAKARFETYLPYAVAFGLDKKWVRTFESVPNVPIPSWYYPVYPGSGYGRGRYIPGTPMARPFDAQGGTVGMPGDIARAGGGSLDDLSGGLSGGLDSISSGLSQMLDSASSAMTSRPQSATTGSSGSWRGGGGSWSGGGFSGGGGSGGGSRGFG